MAEERPRKSGLLARGRERRRLRRETRGDTPERRAERAKKPAEEDPKKLGGAGGMAGFPGA